MNRMAFVFLLLLFPAFLTAQFKYTPETQSTGNGIGMQSAGNLFLGFIDLNRLQMNHTFSASYMTAGNGQGMMLNSYMNTINYRVSDPLHLRVNIGLANSPYNSFDQLGPGFNSTQFFGSAELFYKPSDNMSLHVGMSISPMMNGYNSRYSSFSPYSSYSPFCNW